MWRRIVMMTLALMSLNVFSDCKEVKFKDCGSELGKITHVYMDPCDATPCIFHKGNNGTITISFIPNTAISSVKASVHGIISGIPLPFPIEGDDGCKDSGLTCPLKDGVEVTYFKALEVMKQYPSLKLIVKWELQNENGKDIACMEAAVQIQ